jgi:hypothetical protein
MEKSKYLRPQVSNPCQKRAMKIRFLSSGQMIDFFKEGFQKDDINN